MSSSYRLSYRALGRCLIAAFLFTPTISSANADKAGIGSESPAIKKVHTSETAKSKKNAQNSPIPVVIVETPEQANYANARAQNSDQHEAADLDAQVRAANAAERSAATAERQEVPAWVQIWLASIGTVIALIALGASIKSGIRSDDAAQKQLRAYLSISAIEMRGAWQEGFTLWSGVHIAAMGQTPAYNIRLICELSVFFTEPPSNVVLSYPSGSSQPRAYWAAIAPKYDERKDVSLGLSAEAAAGLASGKYMPHLIGTVTYDDVFGNEWVYRFCFRFMPNGKPSQQDIEHYNKPA